MVTNRPKCQVPNCGKNAHNKSTTANPRWRKASWVREEFGVEEGYVCNKHHFKNYAIGGWVYKQHRKTYCENIDNRLGHGKCTTTIIDPEWQLEVDHIDGNHDNNEESNLQTLCACCHRLKTRDNRDYLSLPHVFIKKVA